MAKVAHEAVRAYSEGLGDFSQVPWEVTPEWQRESVLKQVELCVADMKIGDVQTTWASWMIGRGWHYGPRVDPNLKMHRALVPWADMTESDRVKLRMVMWITGVLKEV